MTQFIRLSNKADQGIAALFFAGRVGLVQIHWLGGLFAHADVEHFNTHRECHRKVHVTLGHVMG